MDDPSSLRSKAEASLRLAELAKTPRARELFRELADEYERRARGELTAELIEQAEAAPSLVPVAPLVADVPMVTDAPRHGGRRRLVRTHWSQSRRRFVPAAPISESNQFVAGLKARFAKTAVAADWTPRVCAPISKS